MKLTRLLIENVLGVHLVDLTLDAPITLLAGANGAGKSSILAAVRMALAQEVERVELKKEYGALVHDRHGAKMGKVEAYLADGRQAWMFVPNGKTPNPNHYTVEPALPFVLDAPRFSRLDGKARRSFLFALMGVKVTPADIRPRLLARGLDAAKVERVLPLLRAGFPDACQEAKTEGTKAKGAWGAVTGETWGSLKGEDWRAHAPPVDEAKLAELQREAAGLDTEINESNQHLGALLAAQKKHAGQEARKVELREVAGQLERRQRKQATDEDLLAEQRSKMAAVQDLDLSQGALPCPECGTMLVRKGEQFVHAAKLANGSDDDIAHLPALKSSVDLCEKTVNNARRHVDLARQAAAELAGLEASGPAPTAAEIQRARDIVDELTARREQNRKAIDALQATKRAAAEADQKTQQALQHHQAVTAWLAIADALAPEGIPSEMLAEVLGPFNDRLTQAGQDTGWAPAKVDSDMAITYGGRPHALLSESEQWRADAMLAEAISHVSGLKLLALDRWDVLQPSDRGTVIEWLHVLADAGELETGILAGTLKGLPSGLPATFAAHWVDQGVLAPSLKAAA